MKVSEFTGRYLFDKLKKLEDELKELGQACDIVSDEIGQQSAAYRILNAQYSQKKNELNKALTTTYREVN